MGLFSRKDKSNRVNGVSIFDTDYPINKNNYLDVFSACLGKVMATQIACGELVVKNQNWNVDFNAGTISFGNQSYPIQFIGGESNSSNTWLWGWKNINGFNEKLLTLVKSTYSTAKEWNLEPLTSEKFYLDENYNGHNMCIITCGIAKENYCYYRMPHSGGNAFVAFSNVPNEVFAPVDLQKFIQISMQCISQFKTNNKIFIESFLIWNRTKYEWLTDNILIAHFSQDLSIEFETVNDVFRIKTLKTI